VNSSQCTRAFLVAIVWVGSLHGGAFANTEGVSGESPSELADVGKSNDSGPQWSSSSARQLDSFVSSFQRLVGADSSRLPDAYPGSRSSNGPIEKTLPGFSYLTTRNPAEGYGILRTSPGLNQTMTAYQQGDVSGAVRTLKDTLGQVDSAQSQNSQFRQGLQVVSTRNALKLAEKAAAVPTNQNVCAAMDACAATALSSDPILFDMNGNGVADVTSLDAGGLKGGRSPGSVFFDITGQGRASQTEWLKPGQDGLLALDVNGNGLVDSASELFGDQDGFDNGYAKLALLDANSDGILSGNECSRLIIWIDANGDGVCQVGECVSASSAGITAVSVTHEGYSSWFIRNGRTCRSWDWFPKRKG